MSTVPSNPSAADSASSFEPHRRQLHALAYRMLGSRAEAEDVAQDAWLRWHDTERASVDSPRAYLSRTVVRLCLDRMKSARAQREMYVGVWLPEPLVDDDEQFQPGPQAAHELASDLSFAFMLTLERLSPLERATFLLHDVFDMPFGEIAVVLDRRASACRQLAARARTKVQANRPAARVSPEVGARLAAAFVSAARDGDVEALAKVLAEDATFLSDGGGRVAAVPYTISGRDSVATVIIGFAGKLLPEQVRVRQARINGLAGLVISADSGCPIQTLAFEADSNGLIEAIYVMRNPDKLQRVVP